MSVINDFVLNILDFFDNEIMSLTTIKISFYFAVMSLFGILLKLIIVTTGNCNIFSRFIKLKKELCYIFATYVFPF